MFELRKCVPASGNIITPASLKVFTLQELKSVTRNFRLGTMFGEGGFGRVYKGCIDDKTYAPSRVGVGMDVAVEKSNPDSNQGLEEWQMNKQIEEGEGTIPEKADARVSHLIPFKIEMPNKDFKPSPPDSIIEDSEFKHICYLLIPAFAAAITLIEAFRLPSLGNYSGSNLFSILLLVNTIVFFISMASITMVMRLLPIIPWLIISVSSTVGLYICATLANFPGEIVPVLFIGGFIFLATFHQFLPTLHIM